MKNIKQNTVTTWRGIKRLYAIVTDLLTGLSALAVMTMAGAYAYQHKHNRPLLAVMAFAVALMGIVAMRVLGSYLNKLGRELEQ